MPFVSTPEPGTTVPASWNGTGHAGVRRIDRRLAGSRAGDVASRAVRADRPVEAHGLRRIVELRIERGRHVVGLVPRRVVRGAQAVIERQARVHTPVVLRIRVELRVADVPRDPVRHFQVLGDDAEQHVRVAVARIERVRARAAAEIERAHVVHAADRRVGFVVLPIDARLERVVAGRLRQVVLEHAPAVVIARRHDAAVGDRGAEARQAGAIAAGGREDREVRVLVQLLARRSSRSTTRSAAGRCSRSTCRTARCAAGRRRRSRSSTACSRSRSDSRAGCSG